MFLVLCGRVAHYGRASLASRTRYFLAKAIACIWYIAAWAAAVVCPAVFISSVIIDEIYVWGYPVSEKYDAVGQASHLTSMCSNEPNE